MGKELEYKLEVKNEAALLKILEDEELAALAEGTFQETPMETTYYDTPEHRFIAHHWTLRRRQEGARSIVCVKIPDKASHTRGEWQTEAAEINEDAITRLVELGTPLELLALYGNGNVLPVCGAKFLRRSVMLRFPDGSSAELAGDCGILHGKEEQHSFTELELELYDGKPEEMLSLVQRLCTRYHLKEQPSSKFARARMLK